MLRTIITGTGCYIPPFIQTNKDFSNHTFYTSDQQALGYGSKRSSKQIQADYGY